MAFPSWRVYEKKDDKYITIGALEVQFWENLCRAQGRVKTGIQKDSSKY